MPFGGGGAVVRGDELRRLLAGLRPVLSEEEYVFCVLPDLASEQFEALAPMAMVRETEGVTVVIEHARAQSAGLSCSPPFQRISLGVHSSLLAVGLTAAVASRLADHGICANMLAGYHHDHIFVPAGQGRRALALLESLQASG